MHLQRALGIWRVLNFISYKISHIKVKNIALLLLLYYYRTRRLHPGRCIDRIPKKAVSGNFYTNDSSNRGSRVHPCWTLVLVKVVKEICVEFYLCGFPLLFPTAFSVPWLCLSCTGRRHKRFVHEFQSFLEPRLLPCILGPPFQPKI